MVDSAEGFSPDVPVPVSFAACFAAWQRARAAAHKLPDHKRLCNAAPACRLPVGKLTSQFFANVYLNSLDQFVKHTLKVRHYVRYVDDFVLLGESPAGQLLGPFCPCQQRALAHAVV